MPSLYPAAPPAPLLPFPTCASKCHLPPNLDDHPPELPRSPLPPAGCYRAQPMRANPRQAALHALFRTYIDVVHVARDESRRLFSVPAGQQDQVGGCGCGCGCGCGEARAGVAGHEDRRNGLIRRSVDVASGPPGGVERSSFSFGPDDVGPCILLATPLAGLHGPSASPFPHPGAM